MSPKRPIPRNLATFLSAAAALSSMVLLACGGATPPAQPTGEIPVAAAPAPTTSAAPASSPAPAPAPKEAEVLAHDSAPPGLTKLSEDEKAFAEKSCGPLADAVAAAVKKKNLHSPGERIALVQSILQDPPKLAGVDVPRCTDLMVRDLGMYLAAAIEAEASMSIGRVVVGLATAAEREPPGLCASAGPVPADLGVLAAGPYASTDADWSAPGWKCARFDLVGQPQRFQYQLVTDAAAGTWEVIARGFPVKGGAPTELYARGRIEGGAIKPSREVYRRAVRK
jgi:hypothetical protein